MWILFLQTLALMTLTGLVGAILGCLLRRMLSPVEAVAVPARVAPAAVKTPAPAAARAAPKAPAAAPPAVRTATSPVVEASKAPPPVTPAAQAERGTGYNYPVTTAGIPRGSPELVQPQIQAINLPSAAAAGAAASTANVIIRQVTAANSYPITTIGIPPGYVELPKKPAVASAPAAVAPTPTASPAVAPAKPSAQPGDASRFERALTGAPAQPLPEPLRPELGRASPPAAPVAPAAPVSKPVAPSVTATVAPGAKVEPATPVIKTVAPAAPVAPAQRPGGPLRSAAATLPPIDKGEPAKPAALAPQAPSAVSIEKQKQFGIPEGAPPQGAILSKPAGIAPKPAAPDQPAEHAKPAADDGYSPIAAGGAAAAAIAARAAAASAAASAAANEPVAPAPIAPIAPANPISSIKPMSSVRVPEAAPVAAPSEPPAPAVKVAPGAPVTGGDDFTRIRAIDEAMQARLKSVGVVRFSEIARWAPADVARISQALGVQGRIEQENWIEQAQILASGGETDYSRRRMRGEILTRPASVAPPAAPGTAASAAAPAAPITHVAASAAPVAPVAPSAPASAAAPAPVGPPASVAPPAKAVDTSSIAAATAAAAAMAQASIARATASVDTAMPSKLADAIRENLAKPAATVSATIPAAVTAVAGQGDRGRPDLAGLRSVRSEALREGGAGNARIDDLKRVRGIGVLIEKKLNSLGITSYEQVANWTAADIDRMSQTLDFKGRIERENWVEQARILASGGQTEFSKRVDRGEA